MKSMMRKSVGILNAVFLIAICLCMSGCIDELLLAPVEMAAAAHEQSLSGYAETVAAWPKIDEGNGRVVLFNSNTEEKGAFADCCETTIDGGMTTVVGPQHFQFVDLPAGKHMIKNGKSTTEIDVQNGRIAYLKIKITDMFFSIKEEAQLVPEKEATLSLKNFKHDFKKPLPLGKQPIDKTIFSYGRSK
jgi:hypothetical protein